MRGAFACNSQESVLYSSYLPWGDMEGENNMYENHTHPHEDTRRVLNRIARAAGHLNAIGQMVEEGRDCSEVLIQLAAVRSAVNNIGKLIINDHMAHCVTDALEHGDQEALRRFTEAMNMYLK